jgi:hypothetical protein
MVQNQERIQETGWETQYFEKEMYRWDLTTGEQVQGHYEPFGLLTHPLFCIEVSLESSVLNCWGEHGTTEKV